MARKKKPIKKKILIKKPPKLSKGIAVLALLLNILILPGLGTLIGGRISTGIWQIVLAIIGAFLSIIIIGIPILIAAWIWGLVSGIKMVQDSE